MSPSLLAHIPKRSKDCHERFRLDTGEWTDSSDESYTESEAPNSNPPQKKLSLPKEGKENRWRFVDKAKEAALQKSLYPKVPLQAQNGLCRTLLRGEMAKTLIIALNPRSKSPWISLKTPILLSLASG